MSKASSRSGIPLCKIDFTDLEFPERPKQLLSQATHGRMLAAVSKWIGLKQWETHNTMIEWI